MISTRLQKIYRTGSFYYLLYFLCTGSYSPFIYVYFADLGLSGEQIGWLASLSPLMMLLLATSIASLADRVNQRVHIIQIALAGLALVIFLLGNSFNFATIILLMLLMAIFLSSIISISDSLIARMAQRYKLNYGGMRLWGSMGFATSAMALGALWQRLGFRSMFIIASMLFLPLIWIAGKLEEGPINRREERRPVTDLFRDSGLVLLLIATFLAGISNSLSMTFGGIYARSLGGGNFLIGMMTAFAAYFELPTMFYSDRIARRLRGPNSVILSYGLMAVAFLGYTLSSNPNFLPFFSILKGIGYGLWFPITVDILTKRTPEEWASTAQSLLTIGMFGLAPLVASPLGGFIHDAISPAAVFGLGVLSLVLAAMVLWWASIRGILA
jgi:MFS transporter, PPP family, 3-phenylpropionic acid transporter